MTGPDLELVWLDTRGIPDWVEKYTASKEPRAMTIGYTVWFDPGEYTWRNLFHELKHVEQFHRHKGDFMDVYSGAVWMYGYKGNKFEKEAREYADRMMKRVENG